MNARHCLAALACLLAALAIRNVFAQASLTPPAGAPAAGMKTLDQVEPRTPISALPFNITQPGSYYITRNLHFAQPAGDAITISAANVTIDLMGFTLSSEATVTGSGILAGPGAGRITVKHGNIIGATTVAVTGGLPAYTWTPSPGGFSYGVRAEAAGPHRFLDLTCSHCQQGGLSSMTVEFDAVVENCTAEQNGGPGLHAGAGSVARCLADNNMGDGITGGTVTACRASRNRGAGITAKSADGCVAQENGSLGIFARTAVNCSAISNGGYSFADGIQAETATNCLATGNQLNGISVTTANGCTAKDNLETGINAVAAVNCTASGNGFHGIKVKRLALNNESSGNGTAAIGGAGITFAGTSDLASRGGRIEGNNCTGNSWGIQASATAGSAVAFIARNTCRGNTRAPAYGGTTGDFDFAAPHTWGPIISSAGGATATGGPWANYRY